MASLSGKSGWLVVIRIPLFVPLQHWNYKCFILYLAFHVGTGDLNSDLHVCMQGLYQLSHLPCHITEHKDVYMLHSVQNTVPHGVLEFTFEASLFLNPFLHLGKSRTMV